MNIKIVLIILAIWLSPSCLSSARAQEPLQRMPDFKRYFEALLEDRAIYECYTDSLFIVKNKTEWISFVKRRTRKIRQLYQANVSRRKELEASCRTWRGKIPVKVYADLFDEFYSKTHNQLECDIPMTLHAVCQVLEYGGEQVMDSLKCINVVNTWKLLSYLKQWNLGKNVDCLRKAYECGKFLLSDEAKQYPYYDFALSEALRYMTKTNWLVYHLQTVEEYRACCRKLDEFLARPDIHQVVSPLMYGELFKIHETKDEALVRNTYLAGDTVLGKQEADSLMHVVVERNLATPRLSTLSYIRTLYMQMELGQITPNEARERCLERYHAVWNRLKNKNLTSRELNDYLQPFYTFFYINYKSTVSYEEKRKVVVAMCRDICRAFMNRQDRQGTTDYVRDLLGIATYDKVMMYLTPTEVGNFMSTMNVAAQTSTYAQVEVCSEMAADIMKDVLEYKPELLLGQLGCNSIDEIRKKSKEFVKFIKEAALYHDIGMNSIGSDTKSEFRPMYDDEVLIYERHPEYGLNYLKQTPGLFLYSDIALGHHKWYNGKGGFPKDFDNTQSPVRIMIDIISLSDGVLFTTKRMAATHVDAEKMADAVIAEIKRGAGTVYNPDLVDLLLFHSDIATKVRGFIQTEWANKFYAVFKKKIFGISVK